MKRFRNILFCVGNGNFNPASLDQVIELARINEAKMKLISPVDELPWYFGSLGKAKSIIETNLFREKKEFLESLAAPIKQKGFHVETSIFQGETFLGVIREVLRCKHDLVVKCSKATSYSPLDSTDLHLLRKCPCPVWLIKPQPKTTAYRNIMAAVDPTVETGPGHLLNHTILKLASSFAEMKGCQLHVAHVWQPHSETILKMVKEYSEEEQINEYLESIRDRAFETLSELVNNASLSLPAENIILRRGMTPDVIADLVKSKKVDHLFMGTVTKNIPGFFIGRTAETILQRVDCSIFGVKPSGFISPVIIG